MQAETRTDFESSGSVTLLGLFLLQIRLRRKDRYSACPLGTAYVQYLWGNTVASKHLELREIAADMIVWEDVARNSVRECTQNVGLLLGSEIEKLQGTVGAEDDPEFGAQNGFL